MKMLLACVLILASQAVIALGQPSSAGISADYRYRVTTVTADLDHPWSVAFLTEGGFLVTERSGTLLKISADGKTRTPITGVPPVAAGDQAGLLDVVLAPDFRTSRTIFLSYTASGAGGIGTEVARARLKGNGLTEVRTIFRALPKTGMHKHCGSRILFAPDGTLIVTLGEKTEMKEAQNRTNHLGKIVRINKDGSVPADNPFRKSFGYKPEIYTWGHRNVQGIILHPVTRQIWIHEHGPLGGDELNILKAGANYGWPVVTYGIDYSGAIISKKTTAPGIEPPILVWIPCIAPSGMTYYNGDRFPKWKGNLFIGSLVQTHLRRLVLEGNRVVRQEALLRELRERIRDVRAGPDGYLYVLTDNDNGRLLRIEPVQEQ
jgi:glucose/arabinose dehydrogenase